MKGDWRGVTHYAIQAKDGRYWHGPDKDDGATWGSPAYAELLPTPKAAQKALEALECPSAAEAAVVAAPAAALVGGEPTEAKDTKTKETIRLLVPNSVRKRMLQ